MKSRIEDVPKLKTEPSMIEGPLFNQVRLALLRFENPLRLRLPGLRGMDIILDRTSWVCVDRTLYDLPVLAWTDFSQQEPDQLYNNAHCLLHYYHIHADLISGTILTTIARELAKRFKVARAEQLPENYMPVVTELRKKKP